LNIPKQKNNENAQENEKKVFIKIAQRFALTFNESKGAEIKKSDGTPLKIFAIQNISTTGTALLFDENPPLEIGDFMNIEFKLAGRNYKTMGEVVRKENNNQGKCLVGLAFKLFNWHEQQALEKYFKEKYKSLPAQNKDNFLSRILKLFK
jgi:hypothetical protein